MGPLVADILNDRERSDDEELEQSLLEDLADETLVNASTYVSPHSV